jgi:hypothetical protein
MAARARISAVKNFILPVGFVGVGGQRWIDIETLKELPAGGLRMEGKGVVGDDSE